MATYLIGKTYFAAGQRDQAKAVLASIGKDREYYAVARYFLAAMTVEEGDLEGAVKQYTELADALKLNVGHKQRLYELTHLALGRLYYELDDFPRAMKEYLTVPPESRDYAEALYETIWVFITRNDRILQDLMRERGRFASLKFDFASFQEELAAPPKSEFAGLRQSEIAEMKGALGEIQSLLDAIEGGMGKLMEEASSAFDKLAAAAPKSAITAEAEVMLGNVYNQVEQYKQAETWFRAMKEKYAGFRTRVAAARGGLRGRQDDLNLIESVIAEKDGRPGPAGAPDLPGEVKGWLADEVGVRETLDVLTRLETEGKLLDEMRATMGEVENVLFTTRMETSYPVLALARERARDLERRVTDLAGTFPAVRGRIAEVADPSQRARLTVLLNQEDGRLTEVRDALAGVDTEVAVKKARELEDFQARYQAIGLPVEEFRARTQALSGEARDVAAKNVQGRLAHVAELVDAILLKASLGEIDVAWKRTQQYNKEINEILRAQEKEIERFREGESPTPATPPAKP
jgi:tetratricopeptide (TPR) repeat protein